MVFIKKNKFKVCAILIALLVVVSTIGYGTTVMTPPAAELKGNTAICHFRIYQVSESVDESGIYSPYTTVWTFDTFIRDMASHDEDVLRGYYWSEFGKAIQREEITFDGKITDLKDSMWYER